MSGKRNLLVVAHTPSPNTQALCDAVLHGAAHPDIENVEVRHARPLQTQPDDVLWAHAIVLGTTENFGYMSGALKDFFDRIYYPCLEHTEGLPYAAYIRAGKDGTGTRTAIEKIATGLRWRAVQEALVLRGDYDERFIGACEELGMAMAAGLDTGIF
ncbi:MAG: flavodoxin family protein [Gammaproteobacteria bacterium]|nr:flavodoxin family protein [Gammaproteobacteria bacterium]